MWIDYVRDGGPLMFAVLAAWVVVLAGVLDRMLYALGRALRRPGARIQRLLDGGRDGDAVSAARVEAAAARAGVTRIDAISQLATSIGLFGTVLGIAKGFLAQGEGADAAARLEGLSSGLSTALYTTIAGLAVFLFGQLALVVYREWLAACERQIDRVLESNS